MNSNGAVSQNTSDSGIGPPRDVYIAVVGTGGVGKSFLAQLENLIRRLSLDPYSPQMSLVLVARSTKVIYTPDYSPLSFEGILSSLENSTQNALSIPEIIDYITDAPSAVVLVDNTSSQDLAELYPQIVTKGNNIITPNKKAFSGTHKLWQDIISAVNTTGAHVYHESSVGAGLPIISTLKDLIDTGDEIIKIEGIFSGTMSFLFNSFAPVEGTGGIWSAEVANAKRLGYTEPDPRDDLNGLDVARKLTILARLAGLPVESPTSFPVESLIPRELESVTNGDEFLRMLPAYDSRMENIKMAAEAEGKVVRYVGSIDVAKNEIKVGLERFERSHPIAALKGSDNIINFYTKRYGKSPLVIQGAGAGAEVTAMGVTADLMKILRRLSH
ncbi:Homoserine dehydrogenase [Podosphaera aphanis]|nr:Homoserine dehydrogenase [Podosphaera aphanis]